MFTRSPFRRTASSSPRPDADATVKIWDAAAGQRGPHAQRARQVGFLRGLLAGRQNPGLRGRRPDHQALEGVQRRRAAHAPGPRRHRGGARVFAGRKEAGLGRLGPFPENLGPLDRPGAAHASAARQCRDGGGVLARWKTARLRQRGQDRQNLGRGRRPRDRLFAAQVGSIPAVVFSPDGQTLAAGGCGRTDDDGACVQGAINLYSAQCSVHSAQ